MAENQSGQEKVHDPTSKRIQDARRKGQVPRSRELNTMALTIGGIASIILLGPHFAEGFKGVFHAQFVLKRTDIFDPGAMQRHLIDAIQDAFLMLLPYFAVLVVLAIFASIALGGFNISMQALTPKLSKFNPIKGMKRIFSPKGVMEMLKSMGKFLLVGSAAVLILSLRADDILALGDLETQAAILHGLYLVGWSAVLIASTLILIALIDVPFQMWNYRRDLKMTQQEVRDELKETEGKPEVKNRIRRTQMEMAISRMMQDVPTADVVVTNPTHYAVALRYDPERMAAPIVVAKGKDLVARTIRDVAKANDVPLVEAPPLARAVYFSTELQRPIPAALFLAVAQLLAYVFQLRAYHEQGGDIPMPPSDYPVPEGYRHG